MDTPFERRVEPWITRLKDVDDAREFVRYYVRLGRAEPFGGYGERFGADLDLEGIAAALRASRGRGLPTDAASYAFLLDAVAALCREGLLRSGPQSLLDSFRPSGFSVTQAGEAWLAAEGI